MFSNTKRISPLKTQRLYFIFAILSVLQIPSAFSSELATSEDDKILKLARDVIKSTRYATLATVDEDGQPRTRIVDAFAPNDDMLIYVATKPNTRKVKQIEENHQVTLFYFDPVQFNYVSIMGNAKLIDDIAVKTKMRRESDTEKFYPNFPDDYILIEISPIWLEGLFPGYRGDPDTWMPARVNFKLE